jgi:ABC-type lipoprotein release transport system permease subunit
MIFIWQAVTGLIIALIADIYPLWRISRLSAVKAMRHA